MVVTKNNIFAGSFTLGAAQSFKSVESFIKIAYLIHIYDLSPYFQFKIYIEKNVE